MDKYDFMKMVEKTFKTCSTKEEIVQRAEHMLFIVDNQRKLAERYLELGILGEGEKIERN